MLSSTVSRLSSSVEDSNGCWILSGSSVRGYIQIKENGVAMYAHRLMYEGVYGKIPSDVVVRHTCDVRNCVNPNHLIKGSRQDNIDDMMNRGRFKFETVQDTTISTCLFLLKEGVSQRDIGISLGISQRQVSRYSRGLFRVNVSVEIVSLYESLDLANGNHNGNAAKRRSPAVADGIEAVE
jgi:hypothetical protein